MLSFGETRSSSDHAVEAVACVLFFPTVSDGIVWMLAFACTLYVRVRAAERTPDTETESQIEL